MRIEEFSKGQVWMLTSGPKRVALVVDTGTIFKDVQVGKGQPPVRQVFGTVTVEVCSPCLPISGHITSHEADVNRRYRLDCIDHFNYDGWTEEWIDHVAERVILEGKPRVVEGEWIHIVKVNDVVGRHGAHESKGKSGSIRGMVIQAVRIADEDVPVGLFDPMGKDDLTQRQIEKERERQEIIAESDRQRAAEKAASRSGDPATYTAWGPWSRLKMQATILDLEMPTAFNKDKCAFLREALAAQLIVLGVDPFDDSTGTRVMDMGKEEFKDAIDNARSRVKM